MRNTVIVQNLKCGGCAKTIISRISEIDHISDVTVDVDTSSVSFNLERAEDEIIVLSKLKELGYPSIGDDNTVLSKVKSYVSCASGKIG